MVPGGILGNVNNKRLPKHTSCTHAFVVYTYTSVAFTCICNAHNHPSAMHIYIRHINMHMSCRYASVMYTCICNADMHPSCTHASVLQTCIRHVNMHLLCRHASVMYTCICHVHMYPSCTHAFIM